MRADVVTGKFTFNYLGWKPLPNNEVILPQVLANAGYRTMGIADTPFLVRRGFGYDRGFHEWTMLYAWEGAKAELYNRKSNPRQENNVIDENPLVAQDLHDRYYELLKEIGTEERLLAPRTRL